MLYRCRRLTIPGCCCRAAIESFAEPEPFSEGGGFTVVTNASSSGTDISGASCTYIHFVAMADVPFASLHHDKFSWMFAMVNTSRFCICCKD